MEAVFDGAGVGSGWVVFVDLAPDGFDACGVCGGFCFLLDVVGGAFDDLAGCAFEGDVFFEVVEADEEVGGGGDVEFGDAEEFVGDVFVLGYGGDFGEVEGDFSSREGKAPEEDFGIFGEVIVFILGVIVCSGGCILGE